VAGYSHAWNVVEGALAVFDEEGSAVCQDATTVSDPIRSNLRLSDDDDLNDVKTAVCCAVAEYATSVWRGIQPPDPCRPSHPSRRRLLTKSLQDRDVHTVPAPVLGQTDEMYLSVTIQHVFHVCACKFIQLFVPGKDDDGHFGSTQNGQLERLLEQSILSLQKGDLCC
jgi:hypothetical protein